MQKLVKAQKCSVRSLIGTLPQGRARRRAAAALMAATSSLGVAGNALAGTYTWDANTVTAGVQDGAGTWNLAKPDWYNGTADQTWPNDFSTAIFGSSSNTTHVGGTVALQAVLNVGAITQDSSVTTTGYTFSSSTASGYYLNFANLDPTIINNAAVSFTFGSNTNIFAVGDDGLTIGAATSGISGAGSVTFAGIDNAFGGINVANGSKLIGSGTTQAYEFGASGANLINLNTSGSATLNTSAGMIGGLIGGSTSLYDPNNNSIGFNTAAGSNDTYAGPSTGWNGNEAFFKWGTGTETFTGAGGQIQGGSYDTSQVINPLTNAYYGSVVTSIIYGGTIALDHTQSGSSATSILVQGARGAFATLAGGTIADLGAGGATADSDVVTLNFNIGASGLIIKNSATASGTGGTSLRAAEGFDVNNGATLLYTMPSGNPSTNNGFYTGDGNKFLGFDTTTYAVEQAAGTSTGIAFGGFIVNPTAYNGGDYAFAAFTGSGSVAIPATSTTSASYTGINATNAASNADNTATATLSFASGADTIINSLRFANTSTSASQGAGITSGNTLVVNSGGILVTPLSANSAPGATRSGVISGGNITAGMGNYGYSGYYAGASGTGGQLIVNQYNTVNPFEISSSIVNNTVTAASTGNGTIGATGASAGYGGYAVSVSSVPRNVALGESVTLPTTTGTITGTIVSDTGTTIAVYFGTTNPGVTFTTTSAQSLTFSMNTGLVKSGPGDLLLSGSNTYTGDTDIDQGTLRLENSGAIQSSSLVTFAGGVLGIGTGYGATSFTRSLGTYGASNAVQWLNSGGFASYGQTTTVNIGGNATPTTLGWGTITGGTLSSATFIPDGGALLFGAADATGTVNFVNPINLNMGLRTVFVTRGSAGVDAIMSGAVANGTGASSIAGQSGIVKDGNGILELEAAETYTGPTEVSNGTLILGYNTSTSTSATLASTNLLLGSSANNDGVFQLGDENSQNSVTFNTIMAGGTGASSIVGGNAATASALTINNTSADTFAGTIGGSTAASNNLSVTKTGIGTLILSGSNTFAGGLTVGSASTVAGSSVGSAFGNGTIVFNAAGTVDLAGFNQTIGGLSDGTSPTGIVTNSGSSAASISFSGASSQTFSGVIQDGASTTGVDLSSTFTGTQTLAGNNTYSGGTSIEGGTLANGVTNALPTGTTLAVSAGAYDLGGYSQAVAALNDGGATSGIVTNSSATLGTLTIAAPSMVTTAQTYGGSLTGNLALVKNDYTTLTLSGTNTHTGPTSVLNGTLNVTGSVTASTITVGNSATAMLTPTLTGNGSAAAVEIQGGGTSGSGGTLAQPSNGTVGLTMASLTLDGGSTAAFTSLNMSTAAFKITGLLTIPDGSAGNTTALTFSTTPVAGDILFAYGSISPASVMNVSSSFTNVPAGLEVDETNNELVLEMSGSPTPEPASATILIVSGGLMLRRRRRTA